MAGNEAKGEPPLPDAQIVNETTGMISAGTMTTGVTLAYLFFELARHPQWHARLRSEVCAAAAAAAAAAAGNDDDAADGDQHNAGRGSGVDAQGPAAQQQQRLSYAVLRQLPVLNAVIWETLRVYPAATVGLPRDVPLGGARVALGDAAAAAADGTKKSVWLPAGTLVSAQTYTV